jgi:hypothetical protein
LRGADASRQTLQFLRDGAFACRHLGRVGVVSGDAPEGGRRSEHKQVNMQDFRSNKYTNVIDRV